MSTVCLFMAADIPQEKPGLPCRAHSNVKTETLLSWTFSALVLWHTLVLCTSSSSDGKDGGLERGSKGISTVTLTKIPSEYLLMMHKVFIKLETAPTAMRGCRLD